MSNDVRIEFAEMVHKTGGTSPRALFRIYEDGEYVCSAVSGVSKTMQATRSISDADAPAVLRENAPAIILRYYRSRELFEQEQVDSETYVVDLTER